MKIGPCLASWVGSLLDSFRELCIGNAKLTCFEWHRILILQYRLLGFGTIKLETAMCRVSDQRVILCLRRELTHFGQPSRDQISPFGSFLIGLLQLFPGCDAYSKATRCQLG